MRGEACVYLGKLFIPYWKKKVIFVKVYEYHEYAEETFKEVSECCIHLKEASTIKKCCITTAGNNYSGTVSLYAVIQFENNKIDIFVCSGCPDSLKLKEVETFAFVDVFCASGDIWLIDGPQLAVTNGCNLGLYSSNTRADFDMQKILNIPVSCFDILNFLLVGHVNTCRGAVTVYIIIVSFNTVNPCTEQIQILIYFETCTLGIFQTGLQGIATNIFFPVSFASSVTAVDVLLRHPDFLESLQNKSVEDAILNLPWGKNQSILCTKDQCYVFSRGFVQYTCNIPYPDIKYVLPLASYSKESRTENIVLQSASVGACCLRTDMKTNSLKCVQEWKDVLLVTVGSLLGNGASHLLLLHSLDLDTWHKECYVFNINTHLGGSGGFRETHSSSDYLKNAVTGLQQRVMAGKAYVTDLQYRISEKQTVTYEILRKLQRHCAPTDSIVPDACNTSFFQASLVDILPLNDSGTLKTRSENELKVALRISGQWKTVLNGNCLFGWTLENVSDRAVMNPKVHLKIENTYQRVVQKLFVHPSEGSPCQPKLNDTVLEKVLFKQGDMFSLVLCFATPTFHADIITASFVISWCEYKKHKIYAFNFVSMIQENASQQFIVKSTIAVSDVLEKCHLPGLSVVQQLMSFRVLQQCAILTISSTYSDLSGFEDSLRSNDQGIIPMLVNHPKMKFLIFNNVHSPLYGINLSWKQLNRTKNEIIVYSKNMKEIVLFTQWMYTVLPSDIIILPKKMKVKEESEIRDKLLVSMKNEVDLILECLASVHGTTAQMPKTLTHTDTSEQPVVNHAHDRIVLSKEKFSKMRASLLKCELLTDTIVETVA